MSNIIVTKTNNAVMISNDTLGFIVKLQHAINVKKDRIDLNLQGLKDKDLDKTPAIWEELSKFLNIQIDGARGRTAHTQDLEIVRHFKVTLDSKESAIVDLFGQHYTTIATNGDGNQYPVWDMVWGKLLCALYTGANHMVGMKINEKRGDVPCYEDVVAQIKMRSTL